MISHTYTLEKMEKKLNDFRQQEPIAYLVLDDFIDPEIFQECEKNIIERGHSIVQHDIGTDRKNKTIFVPGEDMAQFYDFFSSEEFQEYVSQIFGKLCKKEFIINQQQIIERCGEKGLIGQLYENLDTFGWHVDGYDTGVSIGTFTYYLGGYEGEWKKEYGGILELGEGDWGNISPYEFVLPKKNRIVFLMYSEKAFHRVTPNNSDIPRISIQATMIEDAIQKENI